MATSGRSSGRAPRPAKSSAPRPQPRRAKRSARSEEAELAKLAEPLLRKVDGLADRAPLFFLVLDHPLTDAESKDAPPTKSWIHWERSASATSVKMPPERESVERGDREPGANGGGASGSLVARCFLVGASSGCTPTRRDPHRTHEAPSFSSGGCIERRGAGRSQRAASRCRHPRARGVRRDSAIVDARSARRLDTRNVTSSSSSFRCGRSTVRLPGPSDGAIHGVSSRDAFVTTGSVSSAPSRRRHDERTR